MRYTPEERAIRQVADEHPGTLGGRILTGGRAQRQARQLDNQQVCVLADRMQGSTSAIFDVPNDGTVTRLEWGYVEIDTDPYAHYVAAQSGGGYLGWDPDYDPAVITVLKRARFAITGTIQYGTAMSNQGDGVRWTAVTPLTGVVTGAIPAASPFFDTVHNPSGVIDLYEEDEIYVMVAALDSGTTDVPVANSSLAIHALYPIGARPVAPP